MELKIKCMKMLYFIFRFIKLSLFFNVFDVFQMKTDVNVCIESWIFSGLALYNNKWKARGVGFES
jgi:hypothetical protein